MEIEYTVPLDKLSGGELRSLLEANGFPGGSRRLGRGDLADVARGAGLEGLTLRGRDAIDAKARELLSVVGRLDRVVAFRPGDKLGLELKQVGEWAVVMAAPAAVESKVRLGDVLAAVDGADVLLEPYDDMFRRVVAATQSPVPFTLTFRPAWHSNLQPDFNVRICDGFDASSSAVLRELDESNRFVQKSAESASI